MTPGRASSCGSTTRPGSSRLATQPWRGRRPPSPCSPGRHPRPAPRGVVGPRAFGRAHDGDRRRAGAGDPGSGRGAGPARPGPRPAARRPRRGVVPRLPRGHRPSPAGLVARRANVGARRRADEEAPAGVRPRGHPPRLPPGQRPLGRGSPCRRRGLGRCLHWTGGVRREPHAGEPRRPPRTRRARPGDPRRPGLGHRGGPRVPRLGRRRPRSRTGPARGRTSRRTSSARASSRLSRRRLPGSADAGCPPRDRPAAQGGLPRTVPRGLRSVLSPTPLAGCVARAAPTACETAAKNRPSSVVILTRWSNNPHPSATSTSTGPNTARA